MSYSEKNAMNAYEFTKKLAFPRLVGTDGEKKAQEIIENELKVIGNPYHSEELKCSKFVINIIFRIVMPLGALILFGAWLCSEPLLNLENPIISLIFSLTGFIWFVLVSRIINMSFGRVPNIGTIYTTKNFVAEIMPPNPKTHLIYLAHYDSKSQLYPGIIRVILFIAGLITGLLYSLRVLIRSIIILSNNIPGGFWTPNVVSFIITFCLNFLLLFNSVGNRSPGALDNATGVATVLELSKIFKKTPPQNLKLTFLICAAEELGLYGSAFYIKNHKNRLNTQTTYFLNFDGIGGRGKTILLTSYGIPLKKTSQTLNNLIFEIVEEKDLRDKLTKLFLPIGAATDHVPIQRAGYEVTMLGSFISSFHTSKDTIYNINEDSLRNVGIIASELANKLDRKFNE